MTTNFHQAADEEAALWFAKRRRGVMTLEERAGLQAWQREPANAAAMAELEETWAALQMAQGHIGPPRLDVQPMRVPKIARSALLAVMCAVTIGVGVISYSGNRDFWTSLDWVDR
jgi:ferric-dicitrate binding protein FerR (iron transport regulator)